MLLSFWPVAPTEPPTARVLLVVAGSQKRRFRLVTAWSSTAEAADLLLADAAEIGAEATAQARL